MVKRFISNDFLNISRGLDYNLYEPSYKFSMRDPLGTSEEVVWDGPAAEPFLPLSAGQLNVVSSDAADVNIPLMIVGLDADYNVLVEEVIINGTTPVLTVNSFLRVNKAYNNGSANFLGNISISSGGQVVAYVRGGYGQTLSSQYTVPAGYTFYLYNLVKTAGKGSDAEISFRVRELGKVWKVQHIVHLSENPLEHGYLFPIRYTEKSDIRIQGFSRSVATDVTASYEFLLVKAVDSE